MADGRLATFGVRARAARTHVPRLRPATTHMHLRQGGGGARAETGVDNGGTNSRATSQRSAALDRVARCLRARTCARHFGACLRRHLNRESAWRVSSLRAVLVPRAA